MELFVFWYLEKLSIFLFFSLLVDILYVILFFVKKKGKAPSEKIATNSTSTYVLYNTKTGMSDSRNQAGARLPELF